MMILQNLNALLNLCTYNWLISTVAWLYKPVLHSRLHMCLQELVPWPVPSQIADSQMHKPLIKMA